MEALSAGRNRSPSERVYLLLRGLANFSLFIQLAGRPRTRVGWKPDDSPSESLEELVTKAAHVQVVLGQLVGRAFGAAAGQCLRPFGQVGVH